MPVSEKAAGCGRHGKCRRVLPPQRQGRRAAKKASPPPGAWFATLLRCRPDSAPGDARGGAPCIRKLKISPFPPGRGLGGWGQERKLKAGRAGDKESKPPGGTCSPCPGGEDHLKRRSSSPPVPPLLGCRHCPKKSISCHSGGKPRTPLCAGFLFGKVCKCRERSNAGVPGAKPPAK